MSITQQDVIEFHEYALARVSNGGADSMVELFRDWLAKQEQEDVNEAIREGIADIEAGRTRSFWESQDDFRRERGLPPRS